MTAPEASLYKPIGDYAFIGDCRTGALVGRDGAIDWLCLPEFYSDSVFAAVLDHRRGGSFSIRPVGPYKVRRRYRDATAVLETTFHCADGMFRLIDCVPLADRDDQPELWPERELLRCIEVLEGNPCIEVSFTPRPNYGREPVKIESRGGLGWCFARSGRLYSLCSELPLAPEGDALHGRIRLPAGARRYFSLVCTERDIAVLPVLGDEAAQRIEVTETWWKDWAGKCRYQGKHREMVLRSAITLKLLDYSLSGAVLAAPTTSLPETLGGSDNWDYRYCWLRDAAITLRAFFDLGYRTEGKAFFGWLLHATRRTWPELNVLYTVYGGQPGDEFELEHFEGYRGSAPVRVGNGARDQLQLDVYGEIVLAAYDYIDHGGHLDALEKHLVLGFGRTICKRWREPDHGIWEVRGERRHYTHSKLMCWAALDCLLRLHERGELNVPVAAFQRARDELAEIIERRAYNPDHNAYMGIFDGDEADAALLQLDRIGFKPAGDPTVEGTYRYLCDKLGRNGLFLRYGPGFNPAQGEEGAFGVCTFWAVSHLVRQGRQQEAEAMFDHAVSFANDLGLFAEEIDPATGAALGNFPQAFTHVGLIDAAMALAGRDPEQGRGRRQ
jgi:GH15 family glucan-1,4-alpha-glucosidase